MHEKIERVVGTMVMIPEGRIVSFPRLEALSQQAHTNLRLDGKLKELELARWIGSVRRMQNAKLPLDFGCNSKINEASVM